MQWAAAIAPMRRLAVAGVRTITFPREKSAPSCDAASLDKFSDDHLLLLFVAAVRDRIRSVPLSARNVQRRVDALRLVNP